MKLSIIIPVYNVSAYLTKCLDSCVNQKGMKSQYEIVVVNDGSTDNSAAILEDYDWLGCRHKVIHQKNLGLSVARNNGVLAAQGDYIWFVDSDDWISENSLSTLSPFLDEGVDVICQRSYYKNYKDREVLMTKEDFYTNGRDLLKGDYDVMAVLYIYRRDFFLNLGFMLEPKIYHEDTHFTPRAVYLSKNIRCITKPLYHYFQREGSIMSKFNSKKVYDQIKILNDLYIFCEEKVCKEDRRGWIGHLMSGPILNILWLSKNTDNKQVKQDVSQFLKSNLRYSIALVYAPSVLIRILGYLSIVLWGNLNFAYSILYYLNGIRSNKK